MSEELFCLPTPLLDFSPIDLFHETDPLELDCISLPPPTKSDPKALSRCLSDDSTYHTPSPIRKPSATPQLTILQCIRDSPVKCKRAIEFSGSVKFGSTTPSKESPIRIAEYTLGAPAATTHAWATTQRSVSIREQEMAWDFMARRRLIEPLLTQRKVNIGLPFPLYREQK